MCTLFDIVDDILIGWNILLCDPSGPAGIIHSRERMIVHSHFHPVKRVASVRCMTITKNVKSLKWKILYLIPVQIEVLIG